MARSNQQNLDALLRRLERFRSRVQRPLEAHREISVAYYQFVIRNFQLEGRLTPGGWKALRPATIKFKRKRGYLKKLVNTGQLKNSFVPFFNKDTAGVRSDLDYAADHQFGVPERNLPARPMLPNQKQSAEIAIKIYRKYIDKQVRRFPSL